MSTRCTTHFRDGASDEAIIYRHADGYPEGHGADLLRFFDEVARDVRDTRFSDPSYLAAKLVVYLAREFAVDYQFQGRGEPVTTPRASRLDFLSVGVVMSDPSDIEYRYMVDCADLSRGRPAVWVESRAGTWEAPVWQRSGVELGDMEMVAKAVAADA